MKSNSKDDKDYSVYFEGKKCSAVSFQSVAILKRPVLFFNEHKVRTKVAVCDIGFTNYVDFPLVCDTKKFPRDGTKLNSSSYETAHFYCRPMKLCVLDKVQCCSLMMLSAVEESKILFL